MSNIYPPPPQIPPPEEEKPVTTLLGMVLANKAWHARHDDLWPPKAGQEPVKPEWRDAIDLYLGNFCRPVKSIANEVHCVACNGLLTKPYAGPDHRGISVDPTSPTLEAKCESCGYPIRCKHAITLPPPNNHVLLVRLEYFPLCYHPSATERRGTIQ